jgi:hypothetical protein
MEDRGLAHEYRRDVIGHDLAKIHCQANNVGNGLSCAGHSSMMIGIGRCETKRRLGSCPDGEKLELC